MRGARAGEAPCVGAGAEAEGTGRGVGKGSGSLRGQGLDLQEGCGWRGAVGLWKETGI